MSRLYFITLSFLLVLFLNFSTYLYSDITDKLIKITDLYKSGSITLEEFKKAKSIILQIQENNNKKIDKVKKEKRKSSTSILRTVEIRKYKDNTNQETMELMEMNIGDYRIYSHRPGGIKIRRISDGEQLMVISDNLKTKYYADGRDIIAVDVKQVNEDQTRLTLRVKNIPVLRWEGKYVSKHNATFYQVMALGNKPFQYYIKLSKKGAPVIGLNYSKFDRKIEVAVEKAKVRLAAKYEISIDEINKIMAARESRVIAALEETIQKEEEKVIKASLETVVEDVTKDALEAELEATIGEVMADELMAALDAEMDNEINQAIKDELTSAIDQAIAEAVAFGIDEATAAAAIAAMLEVYARGGSDAEAMAACQSIAGDAC